MVKSELYVKLAGVLGFGLSPEPHGPKMRKDADPHMSPEVEQMAGSTQNTITVDFRGPRICHSYLLQKCTVIYSWPFDVGLCLLTCGS